MPFTWTHVWCVLVFTCLVIMTLALGHLAWAWM